MPADASRKRGPYRKSDARRREILDAAFEVFASAGFRGGSLKDIGARIGIDPSTILHHFGSKEALLHAVLDDKQARDSDGREFGALAAASIPGALLELAQRNDRVPGLISLYAVLSAESTTLDHPGAAYFRERAEATRRAFRAGFQAMADEGMLAPGVTPEYAAISTFALWDGIQIHWLIDPDSVSVTDALRRHLRVITTVEL